MTQYQDRNNTRLKDTQGAAQLAFPWIQMNESSNSKECTVCWEECNKYLCCSQHDNHCICIECAFKMVENKRYITPQGSIDLKWQCPMCRHDNPIGSWQFVQAQQPQAQQPQAQQPESHVSWPQSDGYRAKYRWIKSGRWPNSKVNNFKAWYLFHKINNINSTEEASPKLISHSELRKAKITHRYEELKNSVEAPWHLFLSRRIN